MRSLRPIDLNSTSGLPVTRQESTRVLNRECYRRLEKANHCFRCLGRLGLLTCAFRPEWLMLGVLLSDSSPLVFTGGLFNESRDSLGLREVDGVAAPGLNRRGARPFGHCTLGVRWDPLVLGSDQAPARLGSPRPFANCAAETRYTPVALGSRPRTWLFLGPRQPRKRRQT